MPTYLIKLKKAFQTVFILLSELKENSHHVRVLAVVEAALVARALHVVVGVNVRNWTEE